MKKLILSVLTLLLAVVMVAGGTVAYFSDTETSVGNTFRAGAIDLQIDNESYYNGVLQDGTGETEDLTWDLTDLTNELFFHFTDLKPGDLSEDTVSIHVEDNDAWVCANITVTASDEDTLLEPEAEDGDVTTGAWNGELDEELQFIFWADDGDNVLEENETVLMTGTPSELPQDGVTGVTYTIADSEYHALKDTPSFAGSVDGDPFSGDTTGYIGKAWCFGDLEEAPVPAGANDPLDNPGVTCDGTLVDNQSQTDNLMGTIAFYAVQARHNEDFVCSDWNPNN